MKKKKSFYKNKKDSKEKVVEQRINYYKMVLKGCKKRHTNLSTTWIDYRIRYDLAPHSWLNECLETFGKAENLRMFLQKSMQQLRRLLATNGENLVEVNAKMEIFQGDS